MIEWKTNCLDHGDKCVCACCEKEWLEWRAINDSTSLQFKQLHGDSSGLNSTEDNQNER